MSMRLLAFVVLIAGDVACGGDSGSAVGAKAPFGALSEAAVSTFEAVVSDGSTQSFEGRREGSRTIGGVDYADWALGAFAAGAPARGGRVWMTWEPGDERLVVAGGEVYWPENGIAPAEGPFISGTFESPITLTLDPPIGEPQSLAVKASIAVGDPLSPTEVVPIDLVATYTLVATDAVAETAAGPVAGCRIYQGSAELFGATHSANVTYHPDLGLIAAEMDYPPPNGFAVDLLGVLDQGLAQSGMNTIKGLAIVSPQHPSFMLDTYDRAGTFDADKTVHAKMLLELRWVDAAKARTDEFPALLAPDFGTLFGWFPAQFVASPVSLFHPAENGQGFTYWYAYVDEAAKNEPGGNGIAYHAGVTLPDFVSSPMRVTGRIIYALAAP